MQEGWCVSLSPQQHNLTFLEDSGEDSGEPGLSVRPWDKCHCSKKKWDGFFLGSREKRGTGELDLGGPSSMLFTYSTGWEELHPIVTQHRKPGSHKVSMHGVHLWWPGRFALKLGDEALGPLLYTRYVNGSWVCQVQRLPLLPRKLCWDLMVILGAAKGLMLLTQLSICV